MNLSELNELDFSNVGNWPVVAKAITIALVCAAVLFGVYYFDTRHQNEELTKLEAQENTLKQRLKVKAAKAANLEAYREQLEEMRQSFGEMRRQLPSKTEVAALLVDISQTGLASGLEFELFQPEPEIAKEFYAELPIKIKVVGTYHEFGAFISGVAALPRIVTLHDISISPKAKGTGKDDKDKDSGELVMTATAKTYRYLDDEEVAQK
jgi:type IV pilus assembly protein PilO